MRIVSLIASSTEIVCRLGLAQELVGRSHECDYPEFVKDLPVCTSPKFNVEGSSYEIDQRVKVILQESLSVYRVDAQIVDALKPSHIITQAQCEVCAVSLKDVEEAACQFISSQPQIVSLEPNSLADIWFDIKRVGAALDISERADKLVVDLSQAMSTIESATTGLVKPRVACIEWIEPLMAAGNWMPELIVMAGGINLFGEAGKHSPWMSFDQLFDQDPDIVIVSPCGFGIERTQIEMHLLQNHPGWNNLKAAKNKRVFVCDGNQYFNRPGPRVLESLEILAEIFHPETFSQKHHGTGWVRADS
jgi:iron complex transport system substrate-binding protein